MALFFDNYYLLNEVGWDADSPTAWCRIIHDDGIDVDETACPLDPGHLDAFWPEPPRYVAPEGPHWTIPSLFDIQESLGLHVDFSVISEFGEAIDGASRSGPFVAQLFGVPHAIQGDSTRRPRNDCDDKQFTKDGWIYVATIDADVFEYYFTVKHGELVDDSFTDAQCD